MLHRADEIPGQTTKEPRAAFAIESRHVRHRKQGKLTREIMTIERLERSCCFLICIY